MRASCYDAAMDDSLSHDLDRYLDGMPGQPKSDYQVDCVLKRNDREVTEVVYMVGSAGGELGPFVRKRFMGNAIPGPAYEKIWAAQRTGQRFLHLPRILSIASDENVSSVLLEWVPGSTLEEVRSKQGPSVALARNVFPSLCDAVMEFHGICEPPLVHRDLTPANIIIGPKGLVTLIDFGIARQWNPQAEADTSCLGTRGYAPPEQFGFGQTDVRSDIYALGMILYHMITGENPNPGISLEASLRQRDKRKLAPVIRKATALDPHSRYASVEELRAAFLAAFQTRWRDEGAEREREEARDGQPERSRPFASWRESAASWGSGRRGVGRLLVKVPTWLGRLWNIGIAIFFFFAEVICIIAMVSPESAIEGIPRGMSSLLFLAFVGLPGATASYLMLDRRRLRRRFPIMDAIPYRKQAVYLIGGTFVVAFVLLIISIVMYNLGPSVR